MVNEVLMQFDHVINTNLSNIGRIGVAIKVKKFNFLVSITN